LVGNINKNYMEDIINKNYVKNKAVGIIKDYMGSATAKAYGKFYETQDNAIVLSSLKEILTEYLDASHAKKILIKEGFIKE